MEKFRDSLKKKSDDKFFGMKVKLALRKDYLPTRLVDKFIAEALQVYSRALNYLEKWFLFENSPYRHFTPFGLGTANKSPSLDEVLEVWMMSPWKNELPPDALHDEVGALDTVFKFLQGTSLEKWCSFFSKESAPILLKLVQYIMSIPVSNASVERIFSVMGNVWTDERNRMCVESVRS